MIADGREAVYQAPWNLFAPVLAIFLAVAGFNLLGDGLRRSLDVRMIEGRE
jgi:peptide/nickel transport system permease protein